MPSKSLLTEDCNFSILLENGNSSLCWDNTVMFEFPFFSSLTSTWCSAKFRGSRVFVCHASLCHRDFLGRIFFSWVFVSLKLLVLGRKSIFVGFYGSKSFSSGCFVGLKFLLVGISWVQDFFLCLFRGSKISSRAYFISPDFFLVGTLWVQNFFLRVFCGSKIFTRRYFVGNSWIYKWAIRIDKYRTPPSPSLPNTYGTSSS